MKTCSVLILTCCSLVGADIKRLDGTTISTAEAESFAKAILAKAQVTGAQIAVINDGGLVWSLAYGLRTKDPDRAMQRDTTTWAASITKSVFATYVMQLVERGEFSLDIPVAKQLNKPLNEYDAYRQSGSEIVSDPRWQLVTPRMLLAHTSSLSNFAMFEPDKKMHLRAQPGKRYSYSGEGINLVQCVIEQQKGKLLDQLMEEALFKPLSMARTALIFRKEFEDNIADRFDMNEKFHAKTRRFLARAAGSMTSTAEDLARFASALLADKILKPATRQSMLKPYVQITTRSQFPSRPDAPEGTEAAKVGLAYGMGWGLLTRTAFGPAFFKEGHGDGAQDYMICFERSKSCMILLTNSDNGERAFRPLLEKILGNTVTPWEWESYSQSPRYHAAIENNRLLSLWSTNGGLLLQTQPEAQFSRQFTFNDDAVHVTIESPGDFTEELPLVAAKEPEKLEEDRLPLSPNAQLETDGQPVEVVSIPGEKLFRIRIVGRDKLNYTIRFSR